jgi:hypothetical protein
MCRGPLLLQVIPEWVLSRYVYGYQPSQQLF